MEISAYAAEYSEVSLAAFSLMTLSNMPVIRSVALGILNHSFHQSIAITQAATNRQVWFSEHTDNPVDFHEHYLASNWRHSLVNGLIEALPYIFTHYFPREKTKEYDFLFTVIRLAVRFKHVEKFYENVQERCKEYIPYKARYIAEGQGLSLLISLVQIVGYLTLWPAGKPATRA